MADGVIRPIGLLERRKHGALHLAQRRLDELTLYPEPVDIDDVKIYVRPWLFKYVLPGFDGWASRKNISLRSEELIDDSDLVTHELCHIWQQQHLPVLMPVSYWLTGYHKNPFEREANGAVAATAR